MSESANRNSDSSINTTSDSHGNQQVVQDPSLFEQLISQQKEHQHLFKLLVDAKWDKITEADRQQYEIEYSQRRSLATPSNIMQFSTASALIYIIDRFTSGIGRTRVLLSTSALVASVLLFSSLQNQTQKQNNLHKIYHKYNFLQNQEAMAILKDRLGL